MGILNVTPDSFSDGGRHAALEQAVAHARQMACDGADIIDVGGESTRPGARLVPAAEECARVIPVISEIRNQTDICLSIDTSKAQVARAALRAGADIINDVTALEYDPAMTDVAKEYRAGVVLMHMQGNPRTMQQNPIYTDVVGEVTDYLRTRTECLTQAGLTRETLALDPGIGFGKSLDHNLELLRGLATLAALRRPLLLGLSRKSFLGRLTGNPVQDRLAASLAALTCAILNGAHIMRVHDVKESCDAIRVAATLRPQGWRESC